MTKVYYLSLLPETPPNSYWDYGIIHQLFTGFEQIETRSLPELESAIVVIPSRSHYQVADRINSELAKIKHVILFLMGDEQSVFPVEKIKHTSIKIWVQNPKPGRHDNYTRLGCGCPDTISKCNELPTKSLDWFFSGQVTHERRKLCVQVLPLAPGRGVIMPTAGFAQGLPQEKYYEKLASAKIVPCPSGMHTPDTFRLFESLELGAVPIADNETPSEDWSGFWAWLFDEPVPFPTLNRYSDLPGYINDTLERLPKLNNTTQAWWLRYKSKLKNKLYTQLEELTGQNHRKTNITVVIPVSPIQSHPDTYILERTIESVRFHHPDAEIILTFDGVRSEHINLDHQYTEHIRRILWKCRFWGNITPYIFDTHHHQVGMMRSVIDSITTPLILYVEQDTPLVTDEQIDWHLIESALLQGESNLVRLHHEGIIPSAHSHMMIGDVQNGLLKTIQWSQRPHLASKAYYRRILADHFTPGAKSFIEDKMHSVVQTAYQADGIHGWNQHKIHIYHPMTGNIKRSYHTDGRAGALKYDDTQVF